MKFFIICIIFFLGGCINGFSNSYVEMVDVSTIEEVVPLADGEKPAYYKSDDIAGDARKLVANHHALLGISSFNGPLQNKFSLKMQANKVGATVILSRSYFTNTETSTYQSTKTITSTAQDSGTVSSTTTYTNPYSQYLGSGSSRGTYNGSTITTTKVPVTKFISTHRYNQQAAYFVKVDRAYKLGVTSSNLTDKLRAQLGRNTGALVHVVINDTPAFYANVLSGDVILTVNNEEVYDSNHLTTLSESAQHPFYISVFRDNTVIAIKVK